MIRNKMSQFSIRYFFLIILFAFTLFSCTKNTPIPGFVKIATSKKNLSKVLYLKDNKLLFLNNGNNITIYDYSRNHYENIYNPKNDVPFLIDITKLFMLDDENLVTIGWESRDMLGFYKMNIKNKSMSKFEIDYTIGKSIAFSSSIQSNTNKNIFLEYGGKGEIFEIYFPKKIMRYKIDSNYYNYISKNAWMINYIPSYSSGEVIIFVLYPKISKIFFYNYKSQKKIKEYIINNSNFEIPDAYRFFISPDSRYMILNSPSFGMWIVDYKTNDVIEIFSTNDRNQIHVFDWSTDSKRIVLEISDDLFIFDAGYIYDDYFKKQELEVVRL